MKENENFTLDKIQKWMQGTILNPSRNTEESISSLIRSSKKLTAQQHLAIYQRSYVARLRECMSKQFECLEYALGKKIFQQFVDQYLQVYPSKNYSLSELGKQFYIFLEETRPDRDLEEKEDWPDFLIELAQFEYNIQIIFDEKNEEKFIPTQLDSQDEFLKLTPVFHLFEYRFPVNYYFQSFKRGEEPELPFEKSSWCAIYRNNFRIGILGLNFWQYQFLKHFKENSDVKLSLEKIGEESGNFFDEVKTYWKHWRELWIKEGVLVGGKG